MQIQDHPRLLDFSAPPLIMGIINATPDSFFPDSRAAALDEGLDLARRMIAEGADILDIGGESSRPGSDYVEAEAELDRVVPLIQAIRRESEIAISVDTRKAAVAREALEAGADLINDISALADDPALAPLAAEYGCMLILMHKRGSPKEMQLSPSFEDTIIEILEELEQGVERALRAGVERRKIILDPGIGFGKRQRDNLLILKNIGRLRAAGFPLLIGHSRKSFLGRITGKEVDERLPATLAAGVVAQLGGADILRVHDVAAARDAAAVVSAVEGADQ